jgi:hypothetical protein
VGIEMLAAQRDEQRAGAHRAAVGRDAVEGGVSNHARARHRRDQLCERTAHQLFLIMVARAASASAAWSASENGILRPLISW